jgi:hypothetical protein
LTVSKVDQALTRRVTEALGRIANWRDSGGRIMIDLPLMYPSGSMVVVDAEQNRDKIWVSDMGQGLVEAEMMGASDSYGSVASKAAKDYGVEYDGNSIFALWVPASRIEAAIVCVANASHTAAADAVRHASEVHSRRHDDMIYERIVRVFGRPIVAKSVEISGLRTVWEAHNVVLFPNGRKAVFEFMTKHPTSVSSKFLKFSDMKSAPLPISLNAVVPDLELDPRSQMIGDVANIVTIEAEDDALRGYAEAS